MLERPGRSSQMLMVRASGADNEKAGDYGVAPAAIGARHVGFGVAEAEEGDYCQAVENPAGEDEEIGEFFEGACQGHQAREHALKN